MKKRILFALLGISVVFSVIGCSSSSNGAGNAEDAAAVQDTASSDSASADAGAETAAASDEAASQDSVSAEESASDESVSEELASITPSDYLISSISDYVTLGDFSQLSATSYQYEITDSVVESEITYELESYADEIEVDRPSQTGDLVYCDLTYTTDSETQSENTYFYIGDEEYGAEFDSYLTGVSVDDTLSFSITFDDDSLVDEWIGQTVSFEVTITSVCELSTPSLETYISEYTDYASAEEYRAALRQSLEDDYADASYSDTLEELIYEAMELSEFKAYPQELYDDCKSSLLSFYSLFVGSEDEEAICEAFEMTSEELEEEVMDSVNRRLLISALCEQNNLELTADDYYAYVTQAASENGYDSAAAFEEDNTRESLVWTLYESLAGAYLYNNAQITEESVSLEEEADEEDVLEELDALAEEIDGE